VRVKTFQGRTLEEVLPEIRRELGPEAVVLGHRPIVEGGVGGFFGKRLVEVTAADSMPNDAQLIELEDRVMGREAGDVVDDTVSELPRARSASAQQIATATAAVAAANMPHPATTRPTTSRIDMVDDWDPAADDELAEEYGTVLRDLATARRDVRDANMGIDGGESRHDHGGGSVRAHRRCGL